MKYNPTYLGEIELTEETLAHYGVKGMRWRNRKGKTKASLRSDRPRSRKRNITGKGSGAQVHKEDLSYKKLDNASRYFKQMDNARTNAEKEAMMKAGFSSLGKKNVNGKVPPENLHSGTAVSNEAEKEKRKLKKVGRR